MRHALAAVVLVALSACGGGGGSPTTTTPPVPPPATPPISGWPAGTTLQLMNGETGQPVQGSVIVGGVSVPAGTPLASAAANGATVDVVMPGFLPRQTLVRTGETQLVLWPDSARLPADYTRALVYTVGVTNGVETLAVMRRLPTRVRRVAMVLSPQLQNDAPTVEAHREAIEGLNGATAPLGLTFQLGGSADFNVPGALDPSAATCADRSIRAFATVWLSNGEVTRAEVTYCGGGIAETPGTIAHEVGHAMGLRHSLDPNDMMFGKARSSRSTSLTSREILALSLMRARRPGTEWPDNDRAATAPLSVRVETVVD